MDRTVARINIAHYRQMLVGELDETKRRMVEKLLAEEEANLAGLEHPPTRNMKC